MAEILKLIACFIMFSGALGMFLFTDPLQRFHAAGKVGIFGLALLMLADAILYWEKTSEWHFISFFGIVILLLTGPFASHILAQALFRSRSRNSK
ncbi:MAG: monovalent cation/H(+) antiporter subunit G [Bdellovibrionota bacterium]|jgi:multicomponent Na+:H+ antiporter subunit G